MSDPMEPVVLDQPTPRARGRAQGERWRDEIAELTQIRRSLTLARGPCATMEEVDALAQLHLPVLQRETPDLHEELVGIAEAASRTPAEIVILNHYTDLKAVPPAGPGRPAAPPQDVGDTGGGTAIYLNTLTGPVLGQTLDLHASAEPFVRILRIRPPHTDEDTLCLTLTGCLGMAGIGPHGVAVTTNDLSSTDGRVGLVWPALIRTMLAADSAVAARARLEATPLSSGHHYMLADGTEFFGIECSGELKVLTQSGPTLGHLHTNHCFDPVLRQREAVSRKSTTFDRINMASTLFAQRRPSSADELWDLLGSHDGRPRSICSHADEIESDPHGSRTCGRIVMALQGGEVIVGRGCSDTGETLRLQHVRVG